MMVAAVATPVSASMAIADWMRDLLLMIMMWQDLSGDSLESTVSSQTSYRKFRKLRNLFRIANLCKIGELHSILKTKTITEQVADHLRREIITNRWGELLPGRDKLIAELGVNGRTIERALVQLEQEGLLESQGQGKRRRIVKANLRESAGMKIGIVVYEPHDIETSLIIELRQQLTSAGHDVSVAPQSLSELKHNPRRTATMLKSLQAQAHIIQAGSTEVLKQAQSLPQPLFALFGELGGLKIPVAGRDAFAACRTVVQRLHECGHRRIVMLSRQENVRPQLGVLESFFLEELKKSGLAHGAYNIPEWDNTANGLYQCLDRLFQLTPPDAIMIDDSILFAGVQNYLLRKRGSAARNVVCICMDYHPSLAWCKPGVPHFRFDPNALVRRIVRWAGNVAKGKEDKRQVFVKAKFVENGALSLRGA